MNQERLSAKVALVTGGAQGIGRGIAERFAAEGAAVAVLDIKLDNAERAAQALRDAGARAIALGGDVAQRETLMSAVAAVEAAFGRLDILVNNAIWVRYGPIEAIAPEALDRMLGTGLKSVVWGLQAALPAMRRAGGGSIINIASAAAFLGMPNALVYCGVKAGVLGLTRSAATDLGPENIRVNAISPGSVETEGVRVNVDEAMRSKRIGQTPLRRVGQPSDIAAAAAFLASDDSAFVTGESLMVDGGVTMAFL